MDDEIRLIRTHLPDGMFGRSLFWLDPFVHVEIDVEDLIEQKLNLIEEKQMRYDLSDREIMQDKARYEVVVENIGTVLTTERYEDAEKCFYEYVEYSKFTPTTDQVTLFGDGEIVLEFECLDENCEDLEEGEVMAGMPVTRRDISKRNGKIPADLPIAEYYPYTIVEVVNERTIVVQADLYYCYNPIEQLYKYVRDVNGVKMRLSLRFNDRWYVVGHNIHHTKTSFEIGKRERRTQHGH